MHLSLAYFCCIREDEFHLLKQTMYEWTMEVAPFDIPISFDEVQCWHERHNSITELIVADNDSQFRLMRVYEDLVARIEGRAGIPIESVVPRSLQMPFHVTLMGFHRCKGEDPRPECTLSESDLFHVYEATQEVSNDIGSSWTGRDKHSCSSSSSSMRMQHAPRFPEKPRKQTGY